MPGRSCHSLTLPKSGPCAGGTSFETARRLRSIARLPDCQIARLPKSLSADSRRGRPEQPIAARFILTDGWPLFGQESLDWQQLRARPISLCGLATLAEMAASAAKGMARDVRLVWTALPRALCGTIPDPPENHEKSVDRALGGPFDLARLGVIVYDRHCRCAQEVASRSVGDRTAVIKSLLQSVHQSSAIAVSHLGSGRD